MEQPTCNLPDLPSAVRPKLSFPDANTVALSKAEFAAMIVFVQGLRDWISAASGCLK